MRKCSALSAFLALLRRDLLLAYRNRSEIASPLIYFVIISSLFPLAVSADARILAPMAAGVVWVAALLSTVVSLDPLFRSDYEDGSLEQIVISPHPTVLLIAAKMCAHWLITGIPLLLAAPVIAYAMHLKPEVYPVLMYTILLGSPILSLVGSIGIALTVGLKRGGLLLVIVVVPLYIPVLVLSTSAVRLASNLEVYAGPLYALAALLVLALTLAPLAVTAALKLSLR